MRPKLPSFEQVRPYLEQMDSSGVYSNFGPLVTELEKRYAKFLGVDPEQVVSTANATLALQGACTLFPPREWLLPVFTFAATLHALLQANLIPRFTDVHVNNFEMVDPLGQAMSLDTGILPVMPFGKRPEPSSFPKGRFTVMDAAASLGAAEGSLTTLNKTQAVVFSLHATKVLGAGEGGLAVFGDVDYSTKFRKWTNFGFDGSRMSIFSATNAKMSEIHAAYALASLDGWSSERQQWETALQGGSSIARELGVASPIDRFDGVRPYWIAQFKSQEVRDAVEAALSLSRIQSRHWWPRPLNEMPAFSAISQHTSFPSALELAGTTLGLPMYRGISQQDLELIRDVIKSKLLG